MVGVTKSNNPMFRLSKKADYGLIALKHLAQHTDESVSAREIAREYRIPAELLAKILQRLARKGLVVSQQGTRGGYVLARDPAKISIVDVIEALDGPIGITPCERGSSCEQLERCTVRDPLMAVRVKMVRILGDTSIYELAG
jgi:Rrf2 family protein